MTSLILRSALAAMLATLPLLDATAAPRDPHPVALDWQLKSVTGQTVKLSDYKGKVVVLNFWATWCPPCVAEIPAFVKLQQQYGPKGLTFIGVNLDEGDKIVVTTMMRRLGINYPVVLGDAKVVFQYGGVPYLPATFVIDRAGRVQALHGGDVAPSVLEAEIKPLL